MTYIFNRFTVYGAMLLILAMIVILFGCEAQNPICSENYCLTGEIFLRSELGEEQEFKELPGTMSEQSIVNLLTVDIGEYDFEPVTVTGVLDWNYQSKDWQYRENFITYLKKVTLEIESDTGRFGENRVILVHLNKDTVHRDANFVEHVDFLDTGTIRLTHHIGMAEYKGDIVGAPTK